MQWRMFSDKIVPLAEPLSFPKRQIPLLLAVGVGAASFWRGAWYVMDAVLFPDDMVASCQACLLLGFGGHALLHELIPRIPAVFLAPAVVRTALVYVCALIPVFVWRGTWLSWDLATAALEPYLQVQARQEQPAEVTDIATEANSEEALRRKSLLISGLVSHTVSVVFLMRLKHLSAALAPPARIGVLSDFVVWDCRRSQYLADVGFWIARR